MPTPIEQAVTYIKAGNIEKGKQLLIEIIRQNPGDENAWLWMSKCVTDIRQKRDCFQRVLQINPNNEFAKEGLRRLEERYIQPASPTKTTSRKSSFVSPKIMWIVGIFAVVCVVLPICGIMVNMFLSTNPSVTTSPTPVPVVLDAISLMGKSLDEIRPLYTVIDPLYEVPLTEPDRDLANIDYGEEYTDGKYKFTIFYDEKYLVNQVDLTVLRYTSPDLKIIGESYKMSEWIAVMQMLNLDITYPPDKSGGIGDIPYNYTWRNHNGYMIWINRLSDKDVILYSKVIKLK